MIKKTLKYIVFLLVVFLVVAVALFLSANYSQTITISYLAGEFTGPLSTVLGIVFVAGVLVSQIISVISNLLNSSSRYFLKRRNAKLEEENKQLRAELEIKDLS